MKTRDRILEAARGLFNAEGVGALSAVDVASAMGISAGHLYYHFKGKPQILAELMEVHAAEVELIAQAMRDACRKDASLEMLWTHVHILVEEAWDARFFYREPALAIENAAVASAARRIIAVQRSAVADCLAALSDAGAIKAGPEVRDGLSGQLVTGIAFHAITLDLQGDTGPPRERVARAAAQVMLPAAALAS
ncbi:MAG: TetR family transcriptional regulator [Caulobacter sp.]|nr:TetR family transcriptional regulator [Caulobacter sp.]